MTINTLYNIGDEVWTCYRGANYSPRAFVVRSIRVQLYEELTPMIQYTDNPLSDGSWVHEKYLFFTREGAEEARKKEKGDQ